MASALVRDLLDAGVHFGHHCSRWNPKMAAYLYGRRNGIHIIDIRETVRGLLRARKYITQTIAKGDDVLFVGTKRQARDAVQTHAERCGMPYVTERWLGGTLTNARTIRSRLQRLEELEALVDSPKWETGYSKKMKSTLSRELRKIRRNLNGIREMKKLPGVIVVVDVHKEANALREARTLSIPTVCLIDSDSDPDMVSIPIPGNDDAMRAITLIMSNLADAVEEGKKARPEPVTPAGRGDNGPSSGRRRGRHGPPPQRVEHSAAPASAPVIKPAEAAVSPVVEAPPVAQPPVDAPAPAPENQSPPA
ncbi:MAG: 30S ribosomal protein S2 [Phycisphaerae bacterium]|nr:30S ribosomal protein S2 [Phycisphaerae bacterium]